MRKARNGPLCNLRTTQALISLRICAGSSRPPLSAYRINGYGSICRRTESVQISLHGCASSSGPSLFAHGIRSFSPRYASNDVQQAKNSTCRMKMPLCQMQTENTLRLCIGAVRAVYSMLANTVSESISREVVD